MSLQNLLKDAQGGTATASKVSASSSTGLSKLLSDAQQTATQPSVSSQPQPVSSQSNSIFGSSPIVSQNFGMQTSTPVMGSAPNVVNSIFQGAMQGLTAPTPEAKFSNAYTSGGIAAGGKVVADTLTDTQNRLADAFNTFGYGGTPQGTTAQKVGAVGNAAMGIVNTIFSPISGVLATFASIPGTNYLANGINKVFGAIGGGASAGAQEAVNELPISQATKDAIQKPVGELAALAAMIFAGKAGESAIGEMTTRVKEVAKKLEVESQSVENKVPVSTPMSRFNEEKVSLPVTSKDKVNTLQPNLAYTPEGQLPVIDYGNAPKPKDGLPVIQMDPPKVKAPGDMTYEPINSKPAVEPTTAPRAFNSGPREVIKDPVLETSKNGSVKPNSLFIDKKTLQTDSVGVPETVKPVEVKGTGETKTRGLSLGVEAKAIENKLVSNLGDLPEYQSVSMKDQAIKAADLLTKDPAMAKAVAMGEKPAPEGVLPESVFVAVEDAAIKNGDVATLRDLASGSKLTSEATTMGQRIRTLAERDPDSPVKAISDVSRARETKAVREHGDIKIAKKKVVDEIRGEIKKSAPTKQSWSEFIDSIQC